MTLAGSAPELIEAARSLAVCWVKLPVMLAEPPGMGCRMVGLVSSLPPALGGSATVDSTVSQFAMSAAVRSSKMAMWRVAQSVPSPGQELTALLVRVLKVEAPSLLKLSTTCQLSPLLSRPEVAPVTCSLPRPASLGL